MCYKFESIKKFKIKKQRKYIGEKYYKEKQTGMLLREIAKKYEISLTSVWCAIKRYKEANKL